MEREVLCAVVQTVVPKGLYSSVKEVMGQPPSFQPIKFSLTRVVLMLAKSSCSLENWGSVGGTQALSPLGKWVTASCSGARPWLRSLSSLALATARSTVVHSKSKTLGTNKFSQPEDLGLNGYKLFLCSVEFSEEQLYFSYV